MKQELITNTNSSRLLLIFAGWSTDSTFYMHIKREGWDVMVCSDYSDFKFDKNLIKGYTTVYLYAWSLGVAVASMVLSDSDVTASFAINGTLMPVSDSYGIAPAIYNGTVDGLNERNLYKFRRRMFLSSADFAQITDSLPAVDDIEHLKSQLRFIRDNVDYSKCNSLKWQTAFIGKNDAIFPSSTQLASWHNLTDIKMLDAPHYIDLQKIIDLTLPDQRVVGNKFRESLATYNSNAEAQRRICEHLVEMLKSESKLVGLNDLKVLEVGPGSGLFTQMYSEIIKPKEADFVDLYCTPRFGIAPLERYFEQDAELFVSSESMRCWDMILSASTLQWFVNLKQFIADAVQRLTDRGELVCSTFLPGNMCELDDVRISPIRYHSRSEVEQWLRQYFKVVETYEETVVLHFPSSRHLLMHLKETGVRGSVGYHRSLSSLLKTIPVAADGSSTLTYRPLYIYATNR
jgi:malonyl-ACP O-methyltransferase BioC